MVNYDETICISVRPSTFGQTLQLLEGLAFAEIRLDDLDPTEEQLAAIFGRPARLIATARPGQLLEARRAEILAAAARLGAGYVDVELDAGEEVLRPVLLASAESGCRVIISHHDFDETPSRTELIGILERCFARGAAVAKIACHARDTRDAARLLGLLDDRRSVVVVGMGPAGRLTRIAGPLLGAELTFATREDLAPTAPGQLTDVGLRRLWRELVP